MLWTPLIWSMPSTVNSFHDRHSGLDHRLATTSRGLDGQAVELTSVPSSDWRESDHQMGAVVARARRRGPSREAQAVRELRATPYRRIERSLCRCPGPSTGLPI